MKTEPFLDFSSGYVRRSTAFLPKQGARKPWRHPQSYASDVWNLRHGRLNDGIMTFKKSPNIGEQPQAEKTLAAAE